MPNRPQDYAQTGSGPAYASIAASSAHTNTTTDANLDSFTIPADALKAGDVIEIEAQGIATATNANDTLTVILTVGGVTIASTGAVDVADNDIWHFKATVQVRTHGASGTIVGCGTVALGVEATVTAKPFKKASTSFDTTAACVVAINADWSAASASDSCRNDVLVVKVLRPATFD